MKYKSKPRFTEAEQFNGTDVTGVCRCREIGTAPHVHTIHEGQFVWLQRGDYVLPEPDGAHFYPVKPDIFEKNWELDE